MIESLSQTKLNYLPDFLKFIHDYHLDAFVQEWLMLLNSLKSNGQQTGIADTGELYNYFASFFKALSSIHSAGELKLYLAKASYTEIGYSEVQKLDTEFVSRLSSGRREIYRYFLQKYSMDPPVIFPLYAELDNFLMVQDFSASSAYIRQMQERIEEENYFKSKLNETSPGFYYLFDKVNDCQAQPSVKLFRYLGYKPSEYEGDERFFRKLIHPQDLGPADEYVSNYINAADNDVLSFEYRLKKSSGEYIWMRNYESIYKRNERQEATHTIGIAYDISKERLMLDELRNSQEQLLEAQDLTSTGSYTWHFNTGKFIYTPQVMKILGLQKGENILSYMTGKVHPADREIFLKAIETTKTEGKDFDLEYRCNVNGEEKIVWGKGKILLENGRPAGLKGTIMDVTQKHHMLENLRQSEALYKHAQEMNKLGNWKWNLEKNSITWSDELFRIYGLNPQSEVITLDSFNNFIHPDDREERMELLEQQFKNPGVKDYYFRIITREGQEKTLYGQSEVIFNENNIPFEMVGTCQDVTQQKALENELYQKTILLEQSNASLQEFAYISSHDLKEPIRKIALFSDKLKNSVLSNLADEDKEVLTKIITSSARMQRMVDEVLALSQVSENSLKNRCDLNQVLAEVLQSLEETITGCNGKISSEKLPAITANESSMYLLFHNLISNALKFRKPGIDPLVEISSKNASDLNVPGFLPGKQKSHIAICIRDNGIGFGSKYAQKIFAIFQRLNSRDRYEGTGIGLAICKRIVEQHKGIIYAESQAGEGAAFTFIIPV